MTKIKVHFRKRLPRVNLSDLEADDPEIISLKVPSGIRVNGSKYMFKTKPFAHQMAALRRSQQLNGGAMFMDPGTGKTAVAIHFVGLKHMEGQGGRSRNDSISVRTEVVSKRKASLPRPPSGKGRLPPSSTKVLIVCPATVIGVWVKEFQKHLPRELLEDIHIFRLSGSRQSRISKIRKAASAGGLSICIINYESVWRLEKQLDSFSPGIVIADECHRIKSARARQSKAMWRIGRKTEYALGLTGTPITGGIGDLWSQWNFMDPEIFGDSWYYFQSEYLKKGGYLQKEIVGYRHLKKLKRKVRRNSFVITKEECLDLPPKIFQKIPVELTEKSKKIYNDMAEQLVAEIEEGIVTTAPIVLVKLLRLSQITGGFIKDVEGELHDIGNEKLVTCVDLIEDRIGNGHKVVVFARFRREISRLEEALSGSNIDSVSLTGSVKLQDRDELVENFQSSSGPPVFISQIASGSLGITLTAADTAIFFSRDFSLATYLQAVDRIHRIGQQADKVTYLHLIVPHSIDDLIHKNLKSKEALAKFVLRKPRAILIP